MSKNHSSGWRATSEAFVGLGMLWLKISNSPSLSSHPTSPPYPELCKCLGLSCCSHKSLCSWKTIDPALSFAMYLTLKIKHKEASSSRSIFLSPSASASKLVWNFYSLNEGHFIIFLFPQPQLSYWLCMGFWWVFQVGLLPEQKMMD